MKKKVPKCFNTIEILGVGHLITLIEYSKVVFNSAGAHFFLIETNFQGIVDNPFSTYAKMSEKYFSYP